MSVVMTTVGGHGYCQWLSPVAIYTMRIHVSSHDYSRWSWILSVAVACGYIYTMRIHVSSHDYSRWPWILSVAVASGYIYIQ